MWKPDIFFWKRINFGLKLCSGKVSELIVLLLYVHFNDIFVNVSFPLFGQILLKLSKAASVELKLEFNTRLYFQRILTELNN